MEASSPGNWGLDDPQTAAWTPANGGMAEPRTAASTPANGGENSREQRDGRAANGGVNSANGGHEVREPRDGRAANGGVNSREPRAWGLAASGLACREGQNTGTNKTLEKTNKTKRGEGTTLTVWVWSSVTGHTAGRDEEHADEDVLQNNSL